MCTALHAIPSVFREIVLARGLRCDGPRKETPMKTIQNEEKRDENRNEKTDPETQRAIDELLALLLAEVQS